MNVGEAIRAKRKEKGMTQIEVAQAAGIAVNSLRLYESGKRQPKQSVFIDIAHALGTNAIELMGYVSKESPRITNSSETFFLDQFGCFERDNDFDIGLAALQLSYDCGMPTESAERALNFFLSRFAPYFRTKEEVAMKPFLDDLNERGKQVAIERIKELAEIPQYQKAPAQDD